MMETALLEKNRIPDEAKAFEFAIEGQSKLKEVTATLRSLKQRRDLAKDLKAKGQIKLFDREIVRTGRAYRIEHANPYPECNKTDAMDAMCEPMVPVDSPVAKVKGSMNQNMQRTLGNALGGLAGAWQDATMRKTINELQSYQNAMMNSRLDQIASMAYMQMQPGAMLQYNDPWSRGYSRSTHKYDLSCEVLNLDDLKVEGSTETETMLPMSALCRLQEAKEKNLFDHMEVWRPAEWKAPDPWLVGVHNPRDERGHLMGATRYFKVCDWR